MTSSDASFMKSSFLDYQRDAATRTFTLKTYWWQRTMTVPSWQLLTSCKSTRIWIISFIRLSCMTCFESTSLDPAANQEMSAMSKTFSLTGCTPLLLKSFNLAHTFPSTLEISHGMRISCGRPKPSSTPLKKKLSSSGFNLDWRDMKKSIAWDR